MQMPTLRQGDQPSRDAWKYEQPGESPRRSRKRETWRMAERPEKASSATKPEKTWSGGIVSMNKQHRTARSATEAASDARFLAGVARLRSLHRLVSWLVEYTLDTKPLL
jgi:hypothetical protein